MYPSHYDYVFLSIIIIYAVGEQCQLLETAFSTYLRESCSDLDMYINSLEYSESCSIGTPGVLIWTPDNDTPDLVYYQVKIIVNSCRRYSQVIFMFFLFVSVSHSTEHGLEDNY